MAKTLLNAPRDVVKRFAGASRALCMQMSRRSIPLLSLFTASCAGSLPHPPFAPQASSALVRIDTPPPPGRVERVPKQPPGADAWVDGEWIRRRRRWYWLEGRWVKTPAGARYAPWVVVRSLEGDVYYAPSVWVDARGSTLSAPTSLDLGVASREAVFDAEGNLEPTGRNLTTAPPLRSHRPPDETPPPLATGCSNAPARADDRAMPCPREDPGRSSE